MGSPLWHRQLFRSQRRHGLYFWLLILCGLSCGLFFFFFACITTSQLFWLSVGIGMPLANSGMESAICISKQLAFTQSHAKCSQCAFFSQESLETQIYDKVQWCWRNCVAALYSLLQLISFSIPCSPYCFSSYEHIKTDKLMKRDRLVLDLRILRICFFF